MDKIFINGGNPLKGEVTISGAKNAAVAILPAALLVDGVCRIENVPDISDVRILLSILEGMGVSVSHPETGVVVLENGVYAYYEHEKLPNSCHGTGDIYASAFVGALMRGKSAYDAAAIAANYTMACIRCTAKLDNHWYGAAFEPVLGELIQALN